MSEIVLVVAAHPDDEVLGAGGTIARHISHGDDVHIVFFTDGVAARGEDIKNANKRYNAALKAADILGSPQMYFNSFPDNKMDMVPVLELARILEDYIADIKPDIVYTHHAGDLNVDHRATHQAVLTACRPQPGSSIKAIYGFEVLSSTEWASPGMQNNFIPVHTVDISEHLEQKLNALKSYGEEMRPFPHSRSYENVKALSTYRGACVGLEYGEAFSIIRQIER